MKNLMSGLLCGLVMFVPAAVVVIVQSGALK
jgi:hypothetical protein